MGLREDPAYRIPYMEDGDIKLHESLAIMRYILERYGELCSHTPTLTLTFTPNPF